MTAVLGGLLFAFLINTFPVSIITATPADSVYCPLQKIWVKRDEKSIPIRNNSLDQICMSDTKKQSLLVEISLKKAFAIDEKGVFETLIKGAKVLDSYRETKDLPQQNLAQVRQTLSFLNTKNNLNLTVALKEEAFCFALNSRPPTFQKIAKFDSLITNKLEKISRNINPRCPPLSI